MMPQKLGRYEVISELGKGAMGLVFLGRDPIIGRELALKTFRLGYSAKDAELEQFRTRFLREAQSAGRLNHPNIVTIHDVVEDGDEFVIAMEYIKGQDLKQLMQRQTERLEVRFVVEVIAQIAEGLDYAHAKGVVHRDIKPANIIITRPEKDKFLAKITDFGIARVDASNLTVEGQLLGTPNYMAPEQIQGKEVDHRADLFSLGVMLYEMLTGKKPFAGENLTVVTHRIVYDAFTPPDQLVAGLPPRIVGVLEKALQKDPGLRYGRGADIARDLRAVLAPESASSRPEPATASFLRDGDSASAPAYTPGATPTQFGVPSGGAQLGGTLFTGTFGGTMGSPGPPAPPAAGMTTAGMTGGGSYNPGSGGFATGAGGANPYGVPGGGTHTQPSSLYPPMPPPAAAEPRKSMAPAAIAGFAIVLVLGSLAYFLLDKKQPAAPQAAATHQVTASEAAELMKDGKAALGRGEASKAMELFEKALVLEPGDQELRRMREQAQRLLLDSGAVRDETQMRERLARAESAMAGRDYDMASTIVNQILVVDPQNTRAVKLKTDLEDARRRKADEDKRVEGRLLTPTGTATAGPAGAAPTTAARSAAPAEATLDLVFDSELSEGILNVWIGPKRVFEENFDFGKNGLFRKSKGAGNLRKTAKVPSGDVKIRTYVVAQTDGKSKTESRDLNAVLDPGASHILRIRVAPDGTFTAALD
jgi:tRNA A-37 threonylcarbamoyl transferase component Bud32